MELKQCEKNGVTGWKCGEDGKCHIGLVGFQRAKRDQMKFKAQEFRKNPAKNAHERKAEQEVKNKAKK